MCALARFYHHFTREKNKEKKKKPSKILMLLLFYNKLLCSHKAYITIEHYAQPSSLSLFRKPIREYKRTQSYRHTHGHFRSLFLFFLSLSICFFALQRYTVSMWIYQATILMSCVFFRAVKTCEDELLHELPHLETYNVLGNELLIIAPAKANVQLIIAYTPQ